MSPAPLKGREALKPAIRAALLLKYENGSREDLNHLLFLQRQEFMFRELLPLEQRLDNVMLTRKRFATIWGGASLLQAHLCFLKELLEKSEWQWDYYINLSESDYPIKSVQRTLSHTLHPLSHHPVLQ